MSGDQEITKTYGNRHIVAPSPEKPLITFALFAFNQEKFIEEAVRGAISQTYNPLEIIISDDCSQDNTFAIMEKCLEGYDGPHFITLRRNLENQGLGRHFSIVCSRASGALIIIAAGDDISVPERTSRIVDRWQQKSRDIMALESAYLRIDQTGAALDLVIPKRAQPFPSQRDVFSSNGWLVGATAAYDRRLFQSFPSIMPSVINEDVVMLQRVFLSHARCETIEEPLVKYRVGVGVSFQSPADRRQAARLRGSRAYTVYLQKLLDMQGYNQLANEAKIIRRMKHIIARDIIFSQGPSLSSILESIKNCGISATKGALMRYFRSVK